MNLNEGNVVARKSRFRRKVEVSRVADVTTVSKSIYIFSVSFERRKIIPTLLEYDRLVFSLCRQGNG